MIYTLREYIKKIPTQILEQELAKHIAEDDGSIVDYVIPLIEAELKHRKED